MLAVLSHGMLLYISYNIYNIISETIFRRVYNDPVYGFKLQAEEIVATTGAVVQGLIQYICRPCITIVCGYT